MGFREFDQGISSTRLQEWKRREAVEHLQDELAQRWLESERIQGILRTAGQSSPGELPELVSHWFQRVRGYAPVMLRHSSGNPVRWTPNSWFAALFPDEKKRYGDAFYEEETLNINGRRVRTPRVLNEDFFAAILGGEKRLGHRMVHLPGEGFLFYDPKVDAFCSVSDEKVEILLSNYLLKCAEQMGSDVDTKPLFQDHRRPMALAAVVKKARSLLAASREFFQGANAPALKLNDRILRVSSVTTSEDFIHRAIAPMQGAVVVVSEAYQGFLRHCHTENLVRMEFGEFKKAAQGLIMEKFQLGLRHDIRNREGRQTHGWKHLRLLPAWTEPEGEAA